ncbi:hypothetical protein [Aeromonas caviae]|uniref:hypothetical protein n=1 Tax=Aeromonas caviae TaxID=648 RepID=UPI0021D07394|nr:hypothetical protein [Aeromonas caviae]MCU7793458.1 hypothetical protein [Aeromonas caviae]
MIDKLTAFSDYFIKIPAAFLVAIISVLGLILFLPEEYSKTLAVDGFRTVIPHLILLFSVLDGDRPF